MSEPVKTRPYRSALRAERARANREAILRAAHAMFLADGYARTPVAAIATAAGVSEDLVYKLFSNKRGLVVEVLNFAVTGEDGSPRVLEQAGPQQVRAEKDQRRQLAMFAADIAGRTSRARPVDDVIRSAGEVDPVLAAKRAEMHRTRLANLRAFVGWLADNGPLRDGLVPDEAAATVWTITGPDVHRLLVDDLGWDHERYHAWVHSTLEAALLP
ncbi:AcrR family transcriptional regulator [Marmoricola sp. URHA0025 HA25]